jgi:UDP-N-acetylmuramoyl-L-alanyl-D-glutamate--2,6-diaminopimelate ligase
MQEVLEAIKKIIPTSVLRMIRPIWHGFLSYVGAIYFGNPSRDLIVVGITGTAGKSSTTQMLAHILNFNGIKTGFVTTVGFSDGDDFYINKHGLSMPGRLLLQKSLRQIKDKECRVAIVEATSEGLAQNRHLAIDFDIALLTNLGEAHLDSHGGFENYRNSKAKLFKALSKSKTKPFFEKKMIGALSGEYAEYFLGFKADFKFLVVDEAAPVAIPADEVFLITNTKEDSDGRISFDLGNVNFAVPIVGTFNAKNASLAASTATFLGVSPEDAAVAMKEFKGAAGRMQEITKDEAFKVFLDYAPEPLGMRNALEALQAIPHSRIIHVFGSTGGHRDVKKRFDFGKISAKYSDLIVITNDDVYESIPMDIIKNVKEGIDLATDKKVKEVLVIPDREEAIKEAVKLAQPKDIVIITGKGSEQFLVLPQNIRIPWDEAQIIRQAIQERS